MRMEYRNSHNYLNNKGIAPYCYFPYTGGDKYYHQLLESLFVFLDFLVRLLLLYERLYFLI